MNELYGYTTPAGKSDWYSNSKLSAVSETIFIYIRSK
jgi:hypothetical protein